MALRARGAAAPLLVLVAWLFLAIVPPGGRGDGALVAPQLLGDALCEDVLLSRVASGGGASAELW